MKRIRLMAVACLMISLVLLFNSCANTEDMREIKENIPESKNVQEKIDNTETQDNTEEEAVVGVHTSYPAPDYEYQIYISDDVILGEVIEEGGSKYTDPYNEKGLLNAWETRYTVRVDKSYKGLFSEGDTVIVTTWNKLGLYPQYEEDSIIANIDSKNEFYLHEGQKGVFMLSYEEIRSSENEKAYSVVYSREGLFEPKETGTASMNEEAKQVYASPSFEITLDRLPGDVQKAEELYQGMPKHGNDDDI